MRVRIEFTDELPADEIVIRCKSGSGSAEKIKKAVENVSSRETVIDGYKRGEQVFIQTDDILFFETDGANVFAHTASDAYPYRVKQRLYELEESLGKQFARVSKSCILNIHYIASIKRNLTASSLVCFRGSHKQVYVSRMYYKNLIRKLGN